MKFVQFSDAHLDSSISGRLRLPADKRETLTQDMQASVSRAVALAAEISADVVLIPGDLFDFESVTRRTSAWLQDELARLDPVPVFIAPGNHDSLRPGSPYSASSEVPWPGNVHIFRSGEFETVKVPGLDCVVTGMAHVHRGETRRLLAKPVERPEADVSLLAFHGSRDGYRPSDKEVTLPFSDEELLAQGFTYAAIGHYHSFGAIEDGTGVRAAYSGCVQGRGLDETGIKGVVVGEIEDGNVRLGTVEVAERRIMGVSLDVTGARDTDAVCARVQRSVDESGARNCDVVHVSLTGAISPDFRLDLQAIENSLACFHTAVDRGNVEPDYDLEALSRESAASGIRSEFVRSMLDLEKSAAADEERRALHDAIYYGLYALDGRKMEPRDAD